MSVFPGERPAQTSRLVSQHIELVTAGSLHESVCGVAVIYTAIMIFMKHVGIEHA